MKSDKFALPKQNGLRVREARHLAGEEREVLGCDHGGGVRKVEDVQILSHFAKCGLLFGNGSYLSPRTNC